jgi:polysaccharide chain length determinant protein (PEP-CTERM system associated)
MKNSGSSDRTQKVLSTTPLSIIKMIWKRKWLSLSVWAILSAATLAVVHHLPPTYRAEVVVLVDSQKIPERYVPSTVNTELQARLAGISERILSFGNLNQVIDELSLYSRDRRSLSPDELVDRMRKDINIKFERGWTGNPAGAFRIAYSGEDPNSVAQVVNRLSVLFVDENLRTREVQAVGTEQFIMAQLAEAKKTLDELETKVSQYKLGHSGELPEQEQSLISTLAQLRSILDANRDSLNRTQDAKIALENNLSMAEINRHALEKSLEQKPVETPPPPREKPQSEVLRERYASMLKRYAPNHPDAVALRRAIEAAIEEERSSPPQTSPVPARVETESTVASSNALQLEQARERIRTLKSEIAQTEKELTSRKAEQDSILKDIATYQERLGRLPLREQEMARLLRDYENSKSNYRMLLDKKLAAEMATDMEHRQKSERFTIVDPARAPANPVKPNRPFLNTAGCLLGLAVGVGLSLLLESRKAVLLGEWELPSGVAVLGRLPMVGILADSEAESKNSGFRRRWPPRSQPLTASAQRLQ